MHVLAGFIAYPLERSAILIKGYAGTGKTTTIGSLVKTLRQHKQACQLMAPTGRAAKVLANYAGAPALTIHKKIYRQQSAGDTFGRFSLDFNKNKDTIFVVDEASMIANRYYEESPFGSGRLLDDLIEYVYAGRNCRLILMGDTAQLPPVGLEMSPALDTNTLVGYGLHVEECELTDVIRQQSGSGILKLATGLREQISGDDTGYPCFATAGMDDVELSWGPGLLEQITDAFYTYSEDQTIIATRSNKRANKFNQAIRARILFREQEIEAGDKLMVVKNNYFWAQEYEKLDFIANGDMMEIMRINHQEELYGKRFADISVRFPDYGNLEADVKIMLDILYSDKPSLGREEFREFYQRVAEDYPDTTGKKALSEKIMGNPHFNALQVKFAWAVTCHKAQGGQWQAVFVDPGWFTDQMLDVGYLRWLYTAMTRATKKLYLVNFDKKFLDEKECMNLD